MRKSKKAQEDAVRAKERYEKAELISVIDDCGTRYDEIVHMLKTKSK